jgi:hypothetical protein
MLGAQTEDRHASSWTDIHDRLAAQDATDRERLERLVRPGILADRERRAKARERLAAYHAKRKAMEPPK